MLDAPPFRRVTFVAVLGLLLTQATLARAFTIIITEAKTPLVPNSVLELAKRLGYYKREGVDVKFVRVRGTPMALAAMIAGQGDMANVSLGSLLALSARSHGRFRAVSSPNKNLSFMIVGRKSIASIDGLRGKKFGVGQIGSLDYTLSWQVLRNRGFDPKELEVLSIGHPHAVAGAPRRQNRRHYSLLRQLGDAS